MTATVTHPGLVLQVLQRLGGPVLDKELRIASRQRKFYLLRFAYVSLLMMVVICVWSATTHLSGTFSPALRASRLAEAAKSIVAIIVWFQFIGAQVLIVASLSDAISGEARRRTLDGILVAPRGGLYIVVGKLASGLLQIALLLSISLPLLAVVRVLGGVPWNYVVSGLCIAVTAAIFAGSLSLLASMTGRHAYQAILLVGLWYLVVWGLLSGLLAYLSRRNYVDDVVATAILFLANPFSTLSATTGAMPNTMGGIAVPFLWPLHCLIMLFVAAIVLVLCVRRVRRAPFAPSPPRVSESPRHISVWLGRAQDWMSSRARPQDPIRRVKGPPIVWKETLASPFRSRRGRLFSLALLVGIILFVVFLSVFFRISIYAVLLPTILGAYEGYAIGLGMSAAGAITREKEAGTWPVLLATPLSGKQIVEGKATGIFRRSWPALALLLALYLLMLPSCPDFNDLASLIVYAFVSMTGTTVFLLGAGLYLSMRLRTTAAGVVCTLSSYFVPQFLLWTALGPSFLTSGAPVGAQIVAVFALSAVSACLYFVAGVLCMRAATRRLRYSVFEEDTRWSLHLRK